MHEAFGGMGQGLILAMVLVYLLMAINFQSWLDPLLIMMALPGAFAGVLWMLVIWHTTLNVQSLMGAIMSVGVATTNGNLLITFANEYMEKENVDPITAAIEAGTTRLRPVLMTALAMILGMLPMSLALGAGGGENAPLGRAVIGGLIAATFMTLLVIPIVYSFVGGTRVSKLQRDAQMRRTLDADRSRERSADVNSMAERIATKPASGPGFYIKWIALPLVAIIVAAGIVLARELSLRSQRGDLEKEAARGRTVLCTKLHGETAARTIISARRDSWLLRDADLRKNFRLRERDVRGQGLARESGSARCHHRIAGDRPAGPQCESDLRPREDHGRSLSGSRIECGHSAADCR